MRCLTCILAGKLQASHMLRFSAMAVYVFLALVLALFGAVSAAIVSTTSSIDSTLMGVPVPGSIDKDTDAWCFKSISNAVTHASYYTYASQCQSSAIVYSPQEYCTTTPNSGSDVYAYYCPAQWTANQAQYGQFSPTYYIDSTSQAKCYMTRFGCESSSANTCSSTNTRCIQYNNNACLDNPDYGFGLYGFGGIAGSSAWVCPSSLSPPPPPKPPSSPSPPPPPPPAVVAASAAKPNYSTLPFLVAAITYYFATLVL